MYSKTGNDQRALLEQAVRQLRETRARLAAVEGRAREPLAIVGVGLRTPGGATTLDELWDLLRSETDAVVPLVHSVDGRRGEGAADAVNSAGLLPQVDGLDAEFFGISADEAALLDPQQRLVLETAWEAAEDAGLPVDELRERPTGVFLGLYGSDYLHLQVSGRADINTFTGSGGAHSMAANRLSYLLDLQGPSLAVDTACSSSLVAVHLAARALRNGECDLAFAGGVNVIIDEVSTVVTGKILPIAPGGRCRTFDESAEGIVRGEGCGVLLLERLSDARAARHPIHGVIRGTAVNHNGRTNGLTAPSSRAQSRLIRRALGDAAVKPDDVVYIEAHGTGTRLGDPIELEALREVYGPGSASCAVGSVKTNFGHQEAAAGITGLLKAMLVLQRAEVPPHLHLRRLNPEIDVTGTRLTIPTSPTPLPPAEGAPRFAAVSSFGFGGANAHVVVESAPDAAVTTGDPGGVPERLLLPLSARSAGALRELAEKHASAITSAGNGAVSDICAAAALRRTHHRPYRLCAIAEDRSELLAELTQAADGTPRRGLDGTPRVAFVFSGQGSQWAGMGSGLLDRWPDLRAEVEACDAIVRDLAGWSILDQLAAPEGESRLHETEIAQVCIGALQLGLAALWRSWGVTPSAVAGHSMGEVVAAHVAGALDHAQAMELLVRRGRLTEQGARGGVMAAIALPAREVQELLTSLPMKLADGATATIGGVNGPRSTVVSGAAAAVRAVVAEAAARGARTRMLPVEYGFHSPLLNAYDTLLAAEVAHVVARPAQIPLYSTVSGAAVTSDSLDGFHWGRNLRQPVLFHPAVTAIAETGITAFIEIGPHPVLLRDLGEILEDAGVAHVAVGSVRRGRSAVTSLYQSLSALYTFGVDVAWEDVVKPPRAYVTLPSYPWQRRRHWLSLKEGVPSHRTPGGSSSTAGTATDDDDVEPERPTAGPVLAFIRERLALALGLPGIEGIPENTELESLGLDSLRVVELKNQIEQRFGMVVSLRAMLESRTPAELTEAIVNVSAPHLSGRPR